MLCPICEEGYLKQEVYYNNVTYKGITRCLPMHGSICDNCCSEQADAEQVKMNKDIMNNFKIEVDKGE